MNIFSKSSDNGNENDSTNASMIYTSPKMKAKWKDTYNGIREINNQNRGYCKIWREEFGVLKAGEGDMKAYMETESHNSQWGKQVFPKQSKVFIFNFVSQNYINSSCWISMGLSHRTHIMALFPWLFYETEFHVSCFIDCK